VSSGKSNIIRQQVEHLAGQLRRVAAADTFRLHADSLVLVQAAKGTAVIPWSTYQAGVPDAFRILFIPSDFAGRHIIVGREPRTIQGGPVDEALRQIAGMILAYMDAKPVTLDEYEIDQECYR
jgi:hypothetical protein